MPNLHRLYKAGHGDHRACGGDAVSRALALRRPGRARKRPAASGRGVDRLAQPRAGDAGAGGPRQSARAQRVRGRADCAAGGARRRAGAVMDAAAIAADRRRHRDAPARSLSSHRSGARARARGAHGAGRDRARRRHEPARRGAMRNRAAPPVRYVPISSSPPAPRPSSWRVPTVRASARSRSTAGTPMPMKVHSTAGWRRCSARSTAHRGDRDQHGRRWRETVVAVVTEFGRTARINGTEGTDHGTGTVAILAGGALKGGRVVADWPGLGDNDLHEEARPQADHRPARRAQGPAARPCAGRRGGAGVAGVP